MPQGKGALAKKKDRRLKAKQGRKEANRAKYTSGSSSASSPSKVSRGPQNAWGSTKTPSTKKLFLGGPNPISKEDHSRMIREEAETRNKEWAALPYEDQLRFIEERRPYLIMLGCSGEAVRQVTKIRHKMLKATSGKKIEVEVETKITVTTKDTNAEGEVVVKRRLKAKERRAAEKKAK